MPNVKDPIQEANAKALTDATMEELRNKKISKKWKDDLQGQREEASLQHKESMKAIDKEKEQALAAKFWKIFEELLNRRQSYSRMQMGFEDAMWELSSLINAFVDAMKHEDIPRILDLEPEDIVPLVNTIVKGLCLSTVVLVPVLMAYHKSQGNPGLLPNLLPQDFFMRSKLSKDLSTIEYKVNFKDGVPSCSMTKDGKPIPELDSQMSFFDAGLRYWLESHGYEYSKADGKYAHPRHGLMDDIHFEELNSVAGEGLNDFFNKKMQVKVSEMPEPPPPRRPNF